MTRAYATLQLLAHGPLSRAEFVAITGWPLGSCKKLLGQLAADGQIKRVMSRRYAIPAGKTSRGME